MGGVWWIPPAALVCFCNSYLSWLRMASVRTRSIIAGVSNALYRFSYPWPVG
jgi:hypothetical protein